MNAADPLFLHSDPAPAMRLILLGNPNVGKSVLFNLLTGRYATVSNYPGTTVEISRAMTEIGDFERELIDTPGTNSLIPQSEDEEVARNILLDSPYTHVLQVGDIKNLTRTLLLTIQLTEFHIPFVLCLNMSDEAKTRGIEVDVDRLSEILGVPVVATSGIRRWNTTALRETVLHPRFARTRLTYPAPVEEGIQRIEALLPELPVAPRAIAVSVLSGDETLLPFLRSHLSPETLAEIDLIREEAQRSVTRHLEVAIAAERRDLADRWVSEVYRDSGRRGGGLAQRLGSLAIHPFWGLPILAAVLYIAWLFVGKLGAGEMVDFVENQIFNAWVNPWTIRLFDVLTRFPHRHVIEAGVVTAAYSTAVPPAGLQVVGRFVHDLFVGQYGIVTMALTYAIAIVLPVVLTFFLFFGLLEDSGYLPRLAVMLNRIFKKMGLNGKAVLPMVLGLGCDTMATLTARILETKKERVIVTLLLALGVPCSAQLGVIVAMLGSLSFVATLIWLSILAGSIFAVGWLAARLVKGEPADFMLELPPIRRPKLSNVTMKVLARSEWYLKEAVPLFVIGTLVLYFADLTGLLVRFQALLAPIVVGALHLPAEATNAFLIGFLRRDYGAAGLFMMQRQGSLDPVQTVVSLTVITLFIPCVANFLVMLKERGTRTGLAVAAFVLVYSFAVGWALSSFLHTFHITLKG